jgi:hypothetical protein
MWRIHAMHGIPSPASGDVTSAAAATVTGKSTLLPVPSPRWRGSDSHCDVTRDTAVDSDNRQPATGNRHRYKKPAEQHVELVCG